MWNSVTWEITKIVNNYGRFGVSVEELVDILDSTSNQNNNNNISPSSSSSLSWPQSAFPFLRSSSSTFSENRIEDPQHQQQMTRLAKMCITMGIVKGNTAMALALTETLRPQVVHKQQQDDGNMKSTATAWVAAVKIKKSSTAYKMRKEAIFAFERILFGDYSKFETAANDDGDDDDHQQNKETVPKRRPRTNENNDLKEQDKITKANKENMDRIATQFARLRKFHFGALQDVAEMLSRSNNNSNTKSKNNQQNSANDASVICIPPENIDEDIHLQNLINKACGVAVTLSNNQQQQQKVDGADDDDDYEIFFCSTRFLIKLLFPALPLAGEGLDLLIAAGRLGISQMAFGRILTSGNAYRCFEAWQAHGVCVSRRLWPLTLQGDDGDEEDDQVGEDQQKKNSKRRGKPTVKHVFVNGDKEPFEPRYFIKESDPFLLRFSPIINDQHHQEQQLPLLPSDQDLIRLDQLPFLAPPRILNILTFAFRKEGFGNKMSISSCIEKYFSQQQQQPQKQKQKQELVKSDDNSKNKNGTLLYHSLQFSKILAQMGFRISHTDNFNNSKNKLVSPNFQYRLREAGRSWIEYPTHFLSNDNSSNNSTDNDESSNNSDDSGDDQTGETSSVMSRSNNTTFSSTVTSTMTKNRSSENNNNSSLLSSTASLTVDKQNIKLLGSKGSDCVLLASPLPFPPHRQVDAVLVNEYLTNHHHKNNNDSNNTRKPIGICTSVWHQETLEEFHALTKNYFNTNINNNNNNDNNQKNNTNRPILNEIKLPFGKSFKNGFVVSDSLSASSAISSSSLVLQRVADTILSLVNHHHHNNNRSSNSSPTHFISGHMLMKFHDGSILARFQAAVLKAENENDTVSPFHPTNLPFSRLKVHRAGQHAAFVYYRKDAFPNETEAANAYKIQTFGSMSAKATKAQKNNLEEEKNDSSSSSDLESNADDASDAAPPPFDNQEQDDADVKNFEQNLLKRQEQSASAAGSATQSSLHLVLLHPNSIDRMFPALFSQAKAGQLQLYSRSAAQFGLGDNNNNNKISNSNIAEPHERPIKWCFIDWILPTLLALWKISLSDYLTSSSDNKNNNAPFALKYNLLEMLPRLPLSVVCTLGINDFDNVIDNEVTADEFETPLGQLPEKLRQRLFPGKIEKEQLARNFGHALHSLSIFGFVKIIESTTPRSTSSSSPSVEFELNLKIEFNQELFCQDLMMPETTKTPNSEGRIHIGTFSLPTTSNQNNNNNIQLTNPFFVQILKMCSNLYEILVGLNNKDKSSDSTTAVQFLFTSLKFARRNQNAVVAGNSSPHHLIALRKTLDRLMMEHFKGHRLLPESVLSEVAEQFSQIPGYSRARKNTENNDSQLVLTMPSKPTPKLTKTSLLEYISCDFPLKNHAAKFSSATNKKKIISKQSTKGEDDDDSLLHDDDADQRSNNIDERADDEENSETDDEEDDTTTTSTSSDDSDDSSDISSSSSEEDDDDSSSNNSSRKKKRTTKNNKNKKSATSTLGRKIRRKPQKAVETAAAAVSTDSAPKPKPKFCGKYTSEGRNTIVTQRGKRNRDMVIGRFDDVPHWTECGFFTAETSKLLSGDASKFFRRCCVMLGLVWRETLQRLRQAFEDESKEVDNNNNKKNNPKPKGKKSQAVVTLSTEEKTLSDLLNLYCQFYYGGKLKEKMEATEEEENEETAASWNQQDIFTNSNDLQNGHDASSSSSTTTEQKQNKRQIQKCKRHLLSILFANDCDYMSRMADSAETLLRDMFPPKIVRAAVRSLTEDDKVSSRVTGDRAGGRIHRVTTNDALGMSLSSSIVGDQRCPERRSWTSDFRGLDFGLRVERSRQKMREIFLMPSENGESKLREKNEKDDDHDDKEESRRVALQREILCHPSSGIVLAQSCFDQIMQNAFGSANNNNNQVPTMIPCFDLNQVQLDKFYERKWKLKQNNNNRNVVVSGEPSTSEFLIGTLDFLENGVSLEFTSKQDRFHTQKVFEEKLDSEISKLLQDAASSIVTTTTTENYSSTSKAIENFKKYQQNNSKTSTTTTINDVNSSVNHQSMSTLLQSLRTATKSSAILENVANGIPSANATDPNFHHRSVQLLANTFAASLLKNTATFRSSNSLLNRWIVALNSQNNNNNNGAGVAPVVTEEEREKRLEFMRSVADLGEELSLDATTSSDDDDDDDDDKKNKNKNTKQDAASASPRRAKKTKIRLNGGAFRNPNDDVNYTNILFVISAIYDLIFDFPGTTEKMISVSVRSPEIISKDELETLLDLMVENGFIARSGYCYRSADDVVEDDTTGTNGVIPSWVQRQEKETVKFRKYYYKPTSSVMDPSKLVLDGF